MSDYVEVYQQQAHACQSSLPWLAAMQNRGLIDFKCLGFPSRHQEEWKYTRTDEFLQHVFVRPLGRTAFSVKQGTSPSQLSLLDAEKMLSTHGIIIKPLQQACEEHPDLIQDHMGQVLQHQHGFQALNTAMLRDGLFIYVPPQVHLDTPIYIAHEQIGDHQASYLRHLIIADTNSRVTVIETYHGESGSCYLTNTVSEISLKAGASVTHYKLQAESNAAYHVGHLAVQQAADSRFESHLLAFGAKWGRSDLTIELAAPNASCLMNGIYAPNNAQHLDQYTVVHHKAPNCRSEQDYKGVLTGYGRAVFNGKIVVEKGAQHTEAKQQNKNLLLSAHAEINTKPQLDIFADDVICTHGATVGQLDDEALFYFSARGIGVDEASRFLIKAFAADNLQRLGDAVFVNWMTDLFNQQIG